MPAPQSRRDFVLLLLANSIRLSASAARRGPSVREDEDDAGEEEQHDQPQQDSHSRAGARGRDAGRLLLHGLGPALEGRLAVGGHVVLHLRRVRFGRSGRRGGATPVPGASLAAWGDGDAPSRGGPTYNPLGLPSAAPGPMLPHPVHRLPNPTRPPDEEVPLLRRGDP